MKVKDKKLVFSKIFQTNLEVGDYVIFPTGKVVWKIKSISSYCRLVALTDFGTTKYLWREEKKVLIKISKEEAIRRVALSFPNRLGYYFGQEDLLNFFKENLER